ncbi:unnamed protein product [Urochloa humidicola]
MEKFQTALSQILQVSSRNGPSLDPPEILIAIHVIDPDKECIPLKKVNKIPLSLLFMRTVIQAICVLPALVDPYALV